MPLKHVSALTLTGIVPLFGSSPIILCWWEKNPTHPAHISLHALLLCKLIPTNGAAMEAFT